MKFVVFGEDWGAHPSSTQHLFKQLSKDHDVHWINSVGMRKPRLRFTDLSRVFNKAKNYFSQSQGEAQVGGAASRNDQPSVYNLAVLPWHDNIFVQSFNEFVFSKKHFDSNEPILYWISVPTAITMINVRPIDKVVYYCGDDFSALAGVDHKMIAPIERKLIAKANLIYVISEHLYNKMPKHKTYMLTHGVDFELFTKPTIIANEIKHVTRFKVGFYGSINEWLDVDLLTKLVTERPNYELILVGTITHNIDLLLSLNNVTHIEAVEHQRLAEFSQHWDVSILPFVDNQQIQACDPLKLKEYLAAGTPVVSTNFPAVNKYLETILVASTDSGFIQRIDSAIALNQVLNKNWKETQSSLAKNHSWSAKARSVEQQLIAFQGEQ
ncbi:glycosyltransferase [Pseudoalteromonas sp. MMG013]|uniref:glycosyltransferase n=1 Tax=Pseudoalteromonas sp. MMG013 TaxID=2822687 RepID=UPI001B38A487|nr:glycosyltransferase [Pseudoalteromonas sp. MMG013]MBQ4863539.1 glycosyltransferase [Pseudoalteromonas sp. MMG013]